MFSYSMRLIPGFVANIRSDFNIPGIHFSIANIHFVDCIICITSLVLYNFLGHNLNSPIKTDVGATKSSSRHVSINLYSYIICVSITYRPNVISTNISICLYFIFLLFFVLWEVQCHWSPPPVSTLKIVTV